MTRLVEWAVGVTAKLPTTNTRIAVTLAMAAGTWTRYVLSGFVGDPWEPSLEWLAFLVAMSGLDAAQFTAKRITHKENGAPHA